MGEVSSEEFDELVRAVEAQIPFNRVLGLHLTELDSGLARLTFDMRHELVGNFSKGILHGGVISSTLDVVGGMAAMMAETSDHAQAIVERWASLGTIDLRVDYLRPGSGEHFAAEGRVIRSGRKVCVTRMELHNEVGTLIAAGTGTYIVA
jgi:uncharacterized protein (TIGR00369 family)